jgi:hypothetical protein
VSYNSTLSFVDSARSVILCLVLSSYLQNATGGWAVRVSVPVLRTATAGPAQLERQRGLALLRGVLGARPGRKRSRSGQEGGWQLATAGYSLVGCARRCAWCCPALRHTHVAGAVRVRLGGQRRKQSETQQHAVEGHVEVLEHCIF